MTKNIKKIGKELMGKSLNSFHRKTGLTQLEKNNEMQDGILNGILSQVDDAYIEKTEQSNVIHLDGSGDGVVVLDSIEGNTMVNCSLDFNEYTMYADPNNPNAHLRVTINKNKFLYKPKTVYTIFIDVVKNTIQGYNHISPIDAYNCVYTQHLRIQQGQTGKFKLKIQTRTQEEMDKYNGGFNTLIYTPNGEEISGELVVKNIFVLEGDWTNKETPPYFEGLQSSFEEKVNDEGKYEIEILSQNRGNLLYNNQTTQNYYYDAPWTNGNTPIRRTPSDNARMSQRIKVLPNTQYSYSCKSQNRFMVNFFKDETDELPYNGVKTEDSKIFTTDSECNYIEIYFGNSVTVSELTLNLGDRVSYNDSPKQNKIKLLINEPLRAIGDIKDKLCVKDGKLMIERNLSSTTLKDIDSFVDNASSNTPSILYCKFILNNKIVSHNGQEVQSIICDKYATVSYDRRFETDAEGIYDVSHNNSVYVKLLKSKVSSTTDINVLNEYFKNNPTYVVYKSATTYEEVTNEYGQPIILEGYEKGTLYVDSIIVPTTTARYTPKMESFKAIKEVNDNNIMLTNDINDSIIPYMLEVDMMILEKEMAIMSHKNIRKIGEKDMTSMQKRTYDMLARLIKGKTLTKEEAQTRVTVYLNADKITDGQAEELMLLIDEVHA